MPDYSLIAEISLFAEGYETSRPLSKKMTKLYKLASEQVSAQPHYDFGMRAVKSVLVMAGAGKRANPDMPENVALIRAMCDSNLPKFLKDDVVLFNAIVQDLFPGVEVPKQASSSSSPRESEAQAIGRFPLFAAWGRGAAFWGFAFSLLSLSANTTPVIVVLRSGIAPVVATEKQ